MSRELPKEETVGSLELVYKFDQGPMPTGVAVSRCGRIFVNFPRWPGNPAEKARAGGQLKGPWPRPARRAAAELSRRHALAHPVWGHRKIWAMVRHHGHVVSEAPCCGCCATRA
jgi:hypothetical protein